MNEQLEKRMVIVVNPFARVGRLAARLTQLRRLFDELLPQAEMVLTRRPRHAIDIARSAAAPGAIIVAAGGDGTVHEVATGILESGQSATLAILPLGSGNDFARQIGMSARPERALGQFRRAGVQRVDVGRVSWRSPDGDGSAPFINALGIGFDGYAATLAPRFKAYPFGLGYLTTILVALKNWKNVRVVVDDTEQDRTIGFSGELFFLTVGNARDSGGGYSINPRASVVDGLLDMCLVEAVGRMTALRMLPSARTGAHLARPEVHYWQAPAVTVTSHRAVPIHTDGEIQTERAERIEATVLPGALRVLVPNTSVGDI